MEQVAKAATPEAAAAEAAAQAAAQAAEKAAAEQAAAQAAAEAATRLAAAQKARAQLEPHHLGWSLLEIDLNALSLQIRSAEDAGVDTEALSDAKVRNGLAPCLLRAPWPCAHPVLAGLAHAPRTLHHPRWSP